MELIQWSINPLTKTLSKQSSLTGFNALKFVLGGGVYVKENEPEVREFITSLYSFRNKNDHSKKKRSICIICSQGTQYFKRHIQN